MTDNLDKNGPFAPGGGRPGVTRRGLLGVGGASAAGLLLASCAEDDAASGPSGGDTSLMEAPQLTELVEAGELPPLEERLPDTPYVVEYLDAPGVYGGTWRALSPPNGTVWMLQRTTGHAYLLRWSADYSELLPDAAEEFEMSEDATEARIKLREGIKWSDGEPFTAHDVVFANNDALYHPELNPASADAVVATAEDDYTVHFQLAEPNGLFLRDLAGPTRHHTSGPRHYLEQFHKDYNPDIDALVEQEGAQDWVDLFTNKGGFGDDARLNTPDLPVLSAWQITEAPGAAGTRAVFTRNPYFWKVDQDGRQLPYIDEVQFSLIEETDVMVTAAANGEVDMQTAYFNTPVNKPVLADSRDSGEYDFFDMMPTFSNYAVLSLNLNAEDPLMREAFQNKDYRIAISHALNRQDVIDVVFQRQGDAAQAAPNPDFELYDEEFATQYTEFDLDLAAEHFELAGYGELDAQGNRLWSDGSPMSFSLGVQSNHADRPDVAQLISGYLAEVGIECTVDNMDGTLFAERVEGNQHQAVLASGDGGHNDMFQDPRCYFPFHNQNSRFAVLWAQWFNSNGEQGEEPPEAAREQMDLYREMQSTGDEDQQMDLMRQILEIAKEEFYCIGLVRPAPGGEYGLVKNNFHNVPETMLSSYYWCGPGPVNPEQFFIEG